LHIAIGEMITEYRSAINLANVEAFVPEIDRTIPHDVDIHAVLTFSSPALALRLDRPGGRRVAGDAPPDALASSRYVDTHPTSNVVGGWFTELPDQPFRRRTATSVLQ
jgi:hypothetical protein